MNMDPRDRTAAVLLAACGRVFHFKPGWRPATVCK